LIDLVDYRCSELIDTVLVLFTKSVVVLLRNKYRKDWQTGLPPCGNTYVV